MEDGGGKGQGRERGREKEGARGGKEEYMMLSRERASVEDGRAEGGRFDERNDRGRDWTRHGRREVGSERWRD